MSDWSCVACGADLPEGDTAPCPACGAPRVARRKRSRAEIRRWRESQYSAEDLVNHAVHRCGVPALGLLYLGVLNAALGLFTLLFGLLGFGGGFVGQFMPLVGSPAVAVVYGLYMLASGVITFVAGRQMGRARLYPLSVAGCVLAMCTLSLWGVILGIPIGVFGLITLCRPRVRAGFAANRPGFDPDQN